MLIAVVGSMLLLQVVDAGPYTLLNPVPAEKVGPIDTDRPDRANSPRSVEAGHVQFEIGVVDYTYDRVKFHGEDARSETLGLAQTEVRLGVLERLEADLFVNPLELEWDKDFTSGEHSHAAGFGDMGVGAKLNLWDGGEDAWKTAMGLEGVVKLPTAKEELGNKHVECTLGVPFQMNMPAGFHLSLEPGIGSERSSANTGQVTSGTFAASLGYSVTEDLDVYIEWWSHFTTEHGQEAQQTFDFGAVYSISERVSVDVGVSLGLNNATPDVEVGAGVSFKY